MSTTLQENQTARYTVDVAGLSVMQNDPKGLEYIAVEDHADMIGMCELTFTTHPEVQWNSFQVGSDVSIKIGGDNRKVFVGNISGLRHAYQAGKNTVTVLAMDPLMKMQASCKVQVFEDMTDSDVVAQVISQAGCTPGTIDATTRVYDYTFQRNESYFTFARRLAARNGYLLLANEGKIDFTKPQYSGSAIDVPKGEVISLDYNFSPREIPPEITSYGWDYVGKTMVSGTANSGDIDTIGGGAPSNDGALYAEPRFVSDVWVDSQSTAKEMAAAELNRQARNFLRGRCTIQGNGQLHVGKLISFSGHPEGFNATGFVLSARHRIYVRGGFTSEIAFASNTYPQ